MTRHCPSACELASLLSGRLPEERAAEIRTHLAECEACFEVATEAAQLLEEDAAKEGPPGPAEALEGQAGHELEADPRLPPAARGRRLPWPALAAAAALLVAIGAAGAWWLSRAPSPGLESLLARAPDSRPGLVRLASAPHRPAEIPLRGVEAPSWELLAEAARIRQLAEEEPTAGHLRALGVAHLLLREPREAVAALRQAHAASPHLEIVNDLAAALIHLGMEEDDPDTIAEGLELLLELEPRDRGDAGAFNQALALEALGLWEQSLDAWESYLTRDPDSPWAEEARERTAALRQRLEAAPTESAELLEREVLEVLLPAWAEATLSGSEDAEVPLAEAKTRAAAHAERHHDPWLAQAVGETATALLAHRRWLAEAVLAHAEARVAYRNRSLEACLARADQAVRALDGLDHSLAPAARLTGASCAYLAGDLGNAERQALQVATLLEGPGGSPLLSGQGAWLAGLVAHAEARPAAAMTRFDAAVGAFTGAGDTAREGGARVLRADLLVHLGRHGDAWREYAALREPRQVDARRRYFARAGIHHIAAAAGHRRLALAVAESLPSLAAEAGDPAVTADAWMLVAQAAIGLGDDERALKALAEAETALEGIPTAAIRRRSAAFAALERADALLRQAPGAAEAALAPALDFEDSAGGLYLRVALVRARASQLKGALPEAEAILRTAIERSHGERDALDWLAHRDALHESREALHHDLVALLVEADRPLAALQVVESWRSPPQPDGRTSLTAPGPAAGHWPELHSQTAALVFLSLPDGLLTWRLEGHEVELLRRPLSRAALEGLVTAAREEVQRQVNAGPAAERLMRAILGGPVPSSASRWVLSPGSALFGVPFGALPSPASGRQLADHHQLVVTPSLASWLEQPERRWSPSGCALMIRGAASGGILYPDLRRLSRLDDEAAAVATHYGCAETVSSPAELAAAVSRPWAVIHYAGHSVASRESAALVLEESGEPALLTATEIAAMRLSAPLVVLGSCSSADGRPSASAGRDSLARAFLAAGASQVVATLWDVRDQDAFAFADGLHGALATGTEPAAALDALSRSWRQEGKPVSSWGGWVLIEG